MTILCVGVLRLPLTANNSSLQMTQESDRQRELSHVGRLVNAGKS